MSSGENNTIGPLTLSSFFLFLACRGPFWRARAEVGDVDELRGESLQLLLNTSSPKTDPPSACPPACVGCRGPPEACDTSDEGGGWVEGRGSLGRTSAEARTIETKQMVKHMPNEKRLVIFGLSNCNFVQSQIHRFLLVLWKWFLAQKVQACEVTLVVVRFNPIHSDSNNIYIYIYLHSKRIKSCSEMICPNPSHATTRLSRCACWMVARPSSRTQVTCMLRVASR